MQRVKVVNKLVKFLKEQGAWDEFVDNIKNLNVYCDYTIRDISGAFPWSRTPEGLDYWHELNNLFFRENKD